jgi:hypothetical protein
MPNNGTVTRTSSPPVPGRAIAVAGVGYMMVIAVKFPAVPAFVLALLAIWAQVARSRSRE